MSHQQVSNTLHWLTGLICEPQPCPKRSLGSTALGYVTSVGKFHVSSSFPSLAAQEHNETPVPYSFQRQLLPSFWGEENGIFLLGIFWMQFDNEDLGDLKCLTCLSHASSAVCHVPHLHHHPLPVCDHTSCCFLPVPLY